MTASDLYVEPVSDALSGKTIEVIVTGSIGAVESVRLVRALRRLGATVKVTLSKGATQFITPLALEWASANKVQTDFSGTASHVASGDVCVIAPSSANFLHKLAAGITDTPSSALAASYCGAKRPVLILPNMHSSLAQAPAVQSNLEKVATWGVIVPSRQEEHKSKFPEPSQLADFVAHHTNATHQSVLVAFGGTKAYIDDVRFLGNYSSGALGSRVTEELYRRGFGVTALAGVCQVLPNSYSELHRFETNEQLETTCKQLLPASRALIFAPAVLDYVPNSVIDGKVRSGIENQHITLKTTPKIIAGLSTASGIKVGFKLETDPAHRDPMQIAGDYIERYKLSMLVVNYLSDVDQTRHKAIVYDKANLNQPIRTISKQELAGIIADHVERGLK